MNKPKIALFLFVLTLFTLPALLSFGIRYLPVEDQPPLGVTKKFYENVAIEDKVTVPYNNFNGIGFSFKNPNLQNKEEIILKIINENGQLARTITLSGWNIPDGGFVRFMFEPITDSKGRKYDLMLTSPSSRKEEALEVYLSRGSDTAALVTYYKPLSALILIRDIYTNLNMRFWEDRTFALFYFGIISLGFGYIVFGKGKTI